MTKLVTVTLTFSNGTLKELAEIHDVPVEKLNIKKILKQELQEGFYGKFTIDSIREI